MKKNLLIGGARYTGTVVSDYLLSQGYQISVLDLFLYKNNHCVLPFIGRKEFSVTTGDFCDPNVLKDSLEVVTNIVLIVSPELR